MKQWPTTRDTLLMKLVDRDQHAAWIEFCEIYEPVVYRYGRQQGLQHADATELTQRVMVSVMRSARKWVETSPPERFRSWLRTVATNTLINLVTREAKHRGAGGTSIDRPEEIEIRETDWDAETERSMLRLAAKRVRPRFSNVSWQAFEMTMLQGASVSDAAAELNTTAGSIYASRARIIRALKQEAGKLVGLSKENS